MEEAHKERDRYQAQYKDLSEKVSRIKTGVADKLKRDAEELKQTEAKVSLLEEEKKKLNDSVEVLKKEIIKSNKEADNLSRELSVLRLDYQKALNEWEDERDHKSKSCVI